MKDEQMSRVMENIMKLMPLFRHKLSRPFEQTAYNEKMGPSQRMALIVLHGEGPMSMTQLAKRLHIFKQQLTAIVDKLEKEKLLNRLTDERDRRVIRVIISEKGDKLLLSQFETIKDTIQAKLANLPEKDLVKLSDALCAINEVLVKLP